MREGGGKKRGRGEGRGGGRERGREGERERGKYNVYVCAESDEMVAVLLP